MGIEGKRFEVDLASSGSSFAKFTVGKMIPTVFKEEKERRHLTNGFLCCFLN